MSTNCRDASDDGYWLDSIEASLGHASFAAGPDHKVDGWQHIRPTDLSGVELPIPENLSFIGYSDRLELSWDAFEDVGDRVTGYRIFRKGPGDSALQSYADVTGKDTKVYADTDIEPDTTYEYAVAALGADSSQGEQSASATVTTQPPPPQPLLTAEFLDSPESHDGESSFTFELRFSENIEDLSYRTLRDHAFEATGGRVEGARRLEPGSNVRWEIAVEPSGKGDVTVVLPVTGDCESDGAVCTDDGRPRSNRLELTVSGPVEEEQQNTEPENSPATGAPTITGTAQVGETLAADVSGIADQDGLSNAAFSYQWLADDAGISGATGASYTLADADEGKAIKVRVSFTDDAGNAESLTSAATDAVAAKPNSPATGQPSISGTAQVGETLTAVTSGIADEDGLTNASYSYQWLADDADISGATGASYTPTAADEGKAVKVRVSFTDDAGNGESLTSATTDAVAEAPSQAELSLSDFDGEGLEAEVLALFVAGDEGGEPALYSASSRWDASGSLLEGDVGIGPDEVALQRVMYLPDGGALRFNDADALSLKDYFGAGGAGNDLTVWVQTAEGRVSFAASGTHSAGGNYVNFELPPDAKALIAGIEAGERFILSLTRPSADD